MQLARLPTKPVAELGVAELAGVASAFDSLAELSDSRVARLLAQLQASTAYIDSLETALDAKERDEAHLRATWDAKDADLDEVRAALTQLSAQYAELVADAEAKDARMQGLVDQLQGKVERAGGQRDAELERQLEEERRLREVERRDFEVRMRAIRSAPTTCGAHDSPAPTADGGVGAERASEIEQAKAELRATLEKDFAVRRAMEDAPLQARIRELEEQLASRSLSGAAADERLTAGNEVELQREVESLTAELDRRFEELCDVRAELGDVAAQRDAAEDHAAQLEEDLAESAASSELATLREQLAGKNAEFAQLDAELATLRLELADKDAKLVRLGEELLSARAAVRDAQPPPQPEPQQEETTRGSERVVVLERQLANAELELVRLRKAHDALAQDNVHWSIALAAKQLELGMVKRNARFALKQPKPNLLPESLKASRKPQKSQETDKADKVKKVDKVEKVLEVAEPAFPSVPTSQPAAPNRAREHARQLLAQRRALLAA
jgi:chromosome segregation ATPase